MKKEVIFVLVFALLLVAGCQKDGYFIKDTQNSPPPTNPQNTIDTSLGTHLWVMDGCAAMYPNEQFQNPLGSNENYDVNVQAPFMASKFDIFVIGDWSNSNFRKPFIQNYVNIVKSPINKPEAKFVYYSDLQQFLWESTALNEKEDAFLHGSDPASLNLVADGNNVIIDWNDDKREKYRGDGEPIFRVSSYNIYRDNNPVPIQNRPYGTTQITDTPGLGTHEYEIKTVRDTGQEVSFSWKKQVNVNGNVPSFYLTDGYVEITEVGTNYNFVFHLKPNVPDTPDLTGRLFIDLVPQNYVLDFQDNEMIWDNLKNEYTLSLNNIPMNPRNPGQPVKFGYAFYFELRNNNVPVVRLPQASNHYYTINVNNRIKAIAYGVYQQNLASQSWRDFYVGHALDILNNIQPYFDGVYVDEGYSNINSRGEVVPVDSNVNVATYNDNAFVIMQALRSQLVPNKLIFHNSLSEINLQPHTNGGLIEGFAYDGSNYVSETVWKDQINNLLISENNGLSFVLPEGFQNSNLQLRMYLLASYLLFKKDGSYLDIYEWGCPTPTSHIYPEYDNIRINLGAAIENPNNINDLREINGLYTREYDNGVVVVNPTSSSISLTLTNSYKKVDFINNGNDILLNDVTGSLNIPRNNGVILIENSPLPTCVLSNAKISDAGGNPYGNGADVEEGTPVTFEVTTQNCAGNNYNIKFELFEVDNDDGSIPPGYTFNPPINIAPVPITADGRYTTTWNVEYRTDSNDISEDGDAGLEYKFIANIVEDNTIKAESSNWIDAIQQIVGGPNLCGDVSLDPGEQCDQGATPNGCDPGGICASDCLTCYYESGNIITLVTKGDCIDDNDGDQFGEYEETSKTVNKDTGNEISTKTVKKECYITKEVEIPFFDQFSALVALLLIICFYLTRKKFSGQAQT